MERWSRHVLVPRRRQVAAATALFLALSFGLSGLSSVHADHVQGGGIQWACGFGGSGRDGHPDQCGIDPVGGEGVQSDGEPEWGPSWIDGDERVLGVVVGDEARAVPVKMLDRHEIVNTQMSGVPVAITYCPLCGSGLTFERTVNMDGQDRVLDFAASGFLFKHDLVMWDAQTGTLWTQILGEPIGTLRDGHADEDHGDWKLKVVATELATWDAWKQAHPDSLMLQSVGNIRYGSAYGGYEDSCQIGISGRSDCDIGGLHPKEEVVGVEGPRGPVAFAYFAIVAEGGVAFHPESGVVVRATPDGLTQAFDAGDRTFSQSGDSWVDQDGNAWDLAMGKQRNGTAQLEPLDFVSLYWFAWSDHHTDTALWLPATVEGAKDREDNGKLPGFTIPIVAGFLILIAWTWRRRTGGTP